MNKHPYTGFIKKAYTNDIRDDGQGYRNILEIKCDVETVDKTSNGVYEYTHKIWIWNNTPVVFNGVTMSWKAYLTLSNRIKITEGMYVSVDGFDKNVSGEIMLYRPSHLGVMLGVDINRV